MPRKKSRRLSAAKTSAVFTDRIRLLQKRIRQWKTDALLLTNPLDICYLTGFCGEDSWAVAPAKGSRISILSDTRFMVEISEDAPQAESIIRHGETLPEALKEVANRRGFKRLAIQPAYVSLQQKKALDKTLGPRRFKLVKDGLLDQRAIKDRGEVALLKRAVDIQQRGLSATLKQIRPGMTELQITAILHYEMGRLGASGPAFGTIIAADANAAKPHAQPGLTKVKKGGILLIDWGAKYRGYHSDMTRVYALGRWPKKMAEIYNVVLEAQSAAIDAIRPGVRLKDVDAVARKIITKAGYGDHYGHGLGHGIGLEIHELPSMHPKSKGELQPNQVITIEPGIYLPGVGGVRLEDDVLVTARGRSVLCDLPKDLKSTII